MGGRRMCTVPGAGTKKPGGAGETASEKKNSKPAADVADAIAAAIAATMTARTAAVPATSAAAANNNSEAGTRPQWRCVRQHQKRQRWKAGVLQLWSEKQSLKKMARQRAIQMMLRAKL